MFTSIINIHRILYYGIAFSGLPMNEKEKGNNKVVKPLAIYSVTKERPVVHSCSFIIPYIRS